MHTRVGRREIPGIVEKREAFRNHTGSMSAENRKCGPWDSGRLSGADLVKFREDMGNISYVVFSYATPIAWVTNSGEVYRVKQKFSVTTSCHSGLLYRL